MSLDGRWRRGLVVLTLIAAGVACGGGGDQTRAEAGASTMTETPNGDAVELFTPPVIEPVPWSIGAVRPDAALVISHAAASYGALEGAGIVTPGGDVVEIEVPVGLQGVEPVATASGFAVFGYECTVGQDNPGGDCVSVQGVVAFYDPVGALQVVRKTPSTERTGVLEVGQADGDVVVVVGVDAWTVTPEAVEVVEPARVNAICGIEGEGIFAAESIATDPAAPEDTLIGFDIVARQSDGSWVSVAEVEDAPEGDSWPFCTPTGIVVPNQLFDGVELLPLELSPDLELDGRRTVGIAGDGRILQREVTVAGQSPVDLETGLPAWIGLSRDGEVALRATSAGWEFLSVAK